MDPVVSVIIPVYNAEAYLPECLDNVCAQTLRDIEIICVNDGSTDGSAAVLADYAARDERIRVITQANSGELSARNTGIAAARGKWIGFIDSDDGASPDMYERLVNNGEKYHADISHCGLVFFYPDGREIPHYGTGMFKQQDRDTAFLDLFDGSQVEPSMCSKLYRAELFRGFDVSDRIEHNGDFYCNIILFGKAGSAVYEDFCGYRYRRRYNVRQSVRSLMGILSVRREMIEMTPPSVRDAAYRLWLSTLVNTLNQISASDEPDAPACYNECLALLRPEREKISILNKKQQIAAKLHLLFPWAARKIYKIYGKYSLYRYEH